jgi:hypothetical protein
MLSLYEPLFGFFKVFSLKFHEQKNSKDMIRKKENKRKGDRKKFTMSFIF